MPAKKYRIELTTEEQQELKALVSKGRAAAYKQTHARILLLSDEARKDGGLTDEEVARSLEIASATVERILSISRVIDPAIYTVIDPPWGMVI